MRKHDDEVRPVQPHRVGADRTGGTVGPGLRRPWRRRRHRLPLGGRADRLRPMVNGGDRLTADDDPGDRAPGSEHVQRAMVPGDGALLARDAAVATGSTTTSVQHGVTVLLFLRCPCTPCRHENYGVDASVPASAAAIAAETRPSSSPYRPGLAASATEVASGPPPTVPASAPASAATRA